MKTVVFGLCDGPQDGERAVEMLLAAGFSNNAVSVLMPDDRGTNAFTHGSLQLLAGIGGVAIPEMGSFIGAGPIVARLDGIGMDGFVGALVGMGVPPDEAKRYEEHLKRGWVLLSVECEDGHQIIRAKGIIEVTSVAVRL